MRKTFLTTVLALLVSTTMFSQGNSGLGFNYQAVVRGVDGFVLPKQSVELRFSLMPGQSATQASWVETHNVTTDALGTVGVTVGKGTKAGGVAATFADVNFGALHYWLKVEINESGSYRELSYTALASVPYAEVATNAVPVGSVMPFASDAGKVPAGWLLCDGKEINRLEYLNLFNVIGTAWGYGNNSTTFNLPDMRGVFLRGVSGDSGKDEDTALRASLKDGGNSANNVGSYQSDAIRNITGEIETGHSLSLFGLEGLGAIRKHGTNGQSTGGGAGVFSKGFTFDASRVVPVGNDNRPQNVYVNYIIKY